MKYAFPRFLRWVLCGVLLFSAAKLTAATISGGYTGPTAPNDGTVFMQLTVTATPHMVGGSPFPGYYDLAWTATGERSGTIPTVLNGFVNNIGTASFGNNPGVPSESINQSGVVAFQSGELVEPGVYRFPILISASPHVNVSGWVYTNEPTCPDRHLSYYLTGIHAAGTEYLISAMDEGAPVGTVLFNEVVPFGQTVHFETTLTAFCGTIDTERRDAANTNGAYNPFTPPTAGPPPPPEPPPPPDNQPPPPDLPEVPEIDPPTPPPPPGPPPPGGGGGEDEIIEWSKDTNAILRGISERIDNTNEMLGQHGEQLQYANERLKSMDEGITVLADDVKRKAEAEEAYKDAMPSTADMAESAAQAVAETQGAMGTLGYQTPSVNSSQGSWTMAFSVPKAAVSFDYNPFDLPWMETVCNWVRTFIAWGLAYYFLRWCLGQLQEARRHVDLVPQTRGNTLPGGFGGQVTAAIAAGIIHATMLSMCFVIYAMWRDGAIGTFNVSNLFSATPLSSAPPILQQGLWVLEKIFPVSTALVCMINYMTFKFQIEAAVMAAATVKRFTNP